MKIGITCYPTYGGSGVVATELGKALAKRGHQIHFISYAMPMRLTGFVAWLLWLAVHLMYLTGFKNRFIALFKWLTAFVGAARDERRQASRQHRPGSRSRTS